MPIWRSKKVIFVHIPKTAGTTVWKMLKSVGGKEVLLSLPDEKIPYHHTITSYRDYVINHTEDDFDDYYKFAVARDPWSRFVSHYYYLSGTKRIDPNMTFADHFEKWFGGLIDTWGDGNFYYIDFLSENGKVPVSRVYSMEYEMDQLVSDLSKIIGKKIPYKMFNRSRSSKMDYSEKIKHYTDNNLLERSLEFFAEDIELLINHCPKELILPYQHGIFRNTKYQERLDDVMKNLIID